VVAHVDVNDKDLFLNMKYVVKYSNKSAIFGLSKVSETFSEVKKRVADYFALPPELIFL